MNVHHVPEITVLMAVYNGEAYLREAIESILDQTFRDFELIIIDDGSTDTSAAIIQNFADQRVKFVKNDTNIGLGASLNRGIELARGTYIARMDADDISLPYRLERQLYFMDKHSEVDVCGSWVESFEGDVKVVWEAPITDGEIKASLLFSPALYHPTVMFRQTKGPFHYNEDHFFAQDFELWCRISPYCTFANIDEVLLRYRLHGQGAGKSHAAQQEDTANHVRRNMLVSALGLEPTSEEMALHNALACWRIEPDQHFLEQAHNWLLTLRDANCNCNVLPQQALTTVLARRWREICTFSTQLGMGACKLYYCSPLRAYLKLPVHHHLVFMLRALLRKRTANPA